jgi:hypothetical protein
MADLQPNVPQRVQQPIDDLTTGAGNGLEPPAIWRLCRNMKSMSLCGFQLRPAHIPPIAATANLRKVLLRLLRTIVLG